MVNEIAVVPFSLQTDLNDVRFLWFPFLGTPTPEVAMFARSVSFHLKPGRAAEFSQLIDKDIIPVLRKQKGFQDEITFVAPGGADAVGISMWDRKESAETYDRSAYASVLKTLAQVVEGTPQVHTYDVSNSTFHKIAARATF